MAHGLGVGLFICRPKHELKIGLRLSTNMSIENLFNYIKPIETYRRGMGFCFLNDYGEKITPKMS